MRWDNIFKWEEWLQLSLRVVATPFDERSDNDIQYSVRGVTTIFSGKSDNDFQWENRGVTRTNILRGVTTTFTVKSGKNYQWYEWQRLLMREVTKTFTEERGEWQMIRTFSDRQEEWQGLSVKGVTTTFTWRSENGYQWEEWQRLFQWRGWQRFLLRVVPAIMNDRSDRDYFSDRSDNALRLALREVECFHWER